MHKSWQWKEIKCIDIIRSRSAIPPYGNSGTQCPSRTFILSLFHHRTVQNCSIWLNQTFEHVCFPQFKEAGLFVTKPIHFHSQLITEYLRFILWKFMSPHTCLSCCYHTRDRRQLRYKILATKCKSRRWVPQKSLAQELCPKFSQRSIEFPMQTISVHCERIWNAMHFKNVEIKTVPNFLWIL